MDASVPDDILQRSEVILLVLQFSSEEIEQALQIRIDLLE
jgi:hypothetical protein